MKTHYIPWSLIMLRIALAPVAAYMGWIQAIGFPYVLLMIIAALSDVYDGVLARKWNIETGRLRQWDSIADTIFFIGVLLGLIFVFPVLILENSIGISAIIGLEGIRYIVDYIKFKRGASYHAKSAKAFGVSLLVAILIIMGTGYTHYFLPVAIVIGIVSELEGLVMSLILPKWTYNVKHVFSALEIRRAYLTEAKE
jgi:phosphatidylglycerophosphate synthase